MISFIGGERNYDLDKIRFHKYKYLYDPISRRNPTLLEEVIVHQWNKYELVSNHKEVNFDQYWEEDLSPIIIKCFLQRAYTEKSFGYLKLSNDMKLNDKDYSSVSKLIFREKANFEEWILHLKEYENSELEQTIYNNYFNCIREHFEGLSFDHEAIYQLLNRLESIKNEMGPKFITSLMLLYDKETLYVKTELFFKAIAKALYKDVLNEPIFLKFRDEFKNIVEEHCRLSIKNEKNK